MDYSTIDPIAASIPAERQSARRHYGVHPYFTRRPHNVVREYILRFTNEEDRVLDPYGGSGVTAIEAFLENRVGIQNDINPLANFIAKGIADLSLGDASDYKRAAELVQRQCVDQLTQIQHMTDSALATLLKRLPLPRNIILPSNSDVRRLHDLFFPRQLASLATIKAAIDKIDNAPARNALTLAFSATLAKVNRTFLSAEGRAESRGGSSIFSIYRYKVAKEPVQLPIWTTFFERVRNVLQAKSEIDDAIEVKHRSAGWKGQFILHGTDVLSLRFEMDGQVDYIFTDPPYGAHISYLDLSTLWNAWLGKLPSEQARKDEIIVGGELAHDEKHYTDRLGQSIAECVGMLKKDRWMSVVFQHWNISYFQAILRAAAEGGADLRAAVSQVGDPIWSMHKKKGNESVLAGELILTFFNTGRPISFESNRPYDLEQQTARILKDHGDRPLYGEYLLNHLIVDAWHQGAIDSLSLSKNSLRDLLSQLGWRYSEGQHVWFAQEKQQSLI